MRCALESSLSKKKLLALSEVKVILSAVMKEIFCIVRGRVQMVMFRDFACRKARSLGLRGYVKNHPDGSVEVVAQGEEKNLHTYISMLEKGSMLSRVDEVEVQWRDASMPFSNFSIRF